MIRIKMDRKGSPLFLTVPKVTERVEKITTNYFKLVREEVVSMEDLVERLKFSRTPLRIQRIIDQAKSL